MDALKCTEMRFASFFFSGFTTMAVMNPLEKKLEKRQCAVFKVNSEGRKLVNPISVQTK